MNEELTPIDNDGFTGSINSGRVGKGSFLKWSDSQHWLDRDGLVPPSPLLVVGVNEILQRWCDGKPTTIEDKPLPDPEELNAAIPMEEWEVGIDGKPRKPWQHTVLVYFVNPATGEIYTYSAATIGAHIAHDQLKESVITMRALRDQKCMPLVNLSERPMKTNFGMRMRPHFEIVDWKTPGSPGDSGEAALPKPSAPQLTGPLAARTPGPKVAAASATPGTATPQPRPGKPPIRFSGASTVAGMSDVKPVTTEELLNNSLEDVPWDA